MSDVKLLTVKLELSERTVAEVISYNKFSLSRLNFNNLKR